MDQNSGYACVETTRSAGAQHCDKTHGVLAYEPPDPLHSLFRGLGEGAVRRLSENDAYELFLKLRWASDNGRPSCPKCGDTAPYSIRRRSFRCSAPGCRKEFSATTGTVFNSRKLSFKQIVVAFNEQLTAERRIVARRLGFRLNVAYKTAHDLRKRLETVATQGVKVIEAKKRAAG